MQTFDQSAQEMLDQAGSKFSPDIEAWIVLDPNNFLADINPGNKITGSLVFDVAKTAVPTTLTGHDSVFLNGFDVLLK